MAVAVDLDQGRERVAPVRGGIDHRARLLDRVEHDGQFAAGIAQRLDPPELPRRDAHRVQDVAHARGGEVLGFRSEEQTYELQSLMCTSYAVFCLKKKKYIHNNNNYNNS